jgi:hypothetical protein
LPLGHVIAGGDTLAAAATQSVTAVPLHFLTASAVLPPTSSAHQQESSDIKQQYQAFLSV